MQSERRLLLARTLPSGVALALVSFGCGQGLGATEVAFELRCEAVYTPRVAEVVCLRHDTRTGESVRLNLAALPSASTPAEPKATDPGVYTLECTSTHAGEKSEVYCVRMHRYTGELSLVTLPKLTVIPQPFPPKAPAAAVDRRAVMRQMAASMAAADADPMGMPPPGAVAAPPPMAAPASPGEPADPAFPKGR
jgi:hypothetical protein